MCGGSVNPQLGLGVTLEQSDGKGVAGDQPQAGLTVPRSWKRAVFQANIREPGIFLACLLLFIFSLALGLQFQEPWLYLKAPLRQG